MAFKMACSIFLVVLISIAKAHSLGDLSQVGDVESLVEEFRKEGERAVKHALNRTNYARVQMSEWSLYKEFKQEDLMELLDGRWKHEIKVLEDKAKEANVTIDECVGRRKTVLDNIPRNFSQVLKNFHSELYNKVFEECRLFLNELNNTVHYRSGEFKREIVDSASSTNSTRCLQVLTSRIELEIKHLPREVEYRVVVNDAKISGYILKFQEFSIEEFRKWESAGQFIVREIVHCAEKKFHK